MAKKPVKSINLLPEFLRTDKNSKFLSSTVDQLIQPPSLERLDGFIGSKLTPTYNSVTDVYIPESLPLRRDYQLEPALVVKDNLGQVKKVKAIDDLANEIVTEGGFNNNFDRLFKSYFSSFDPHIDFDKFVNYQKYYWLVNGPDTITITGKQRNTISTYSVVDNAIKSAWIFSPDGLTEDPTITLYRGNVYRFSVNSSYKFFIKNSPSLGTEDLFTTNVVNNGVKNGVLYIRITENTPSTLYYTSDEVNYLQGKIVIKQATEDAYINVEQEILGKQNYVSGTGIRLSNGMKIRFEGDVYPESYKDKEYYVEGVGTSIKLIDTTLLTVSEKLSAQFDDDFDATNFDEYPFDSFKELPLNPEYITINRSSQDLNPWSRYNRWVHEDVIIAAANANNNPIVIPGENRAKRPIIEFAADLQLYNFGSRGVKGIDLIDNETLDAFSMVEGSSGYYVDGVRLQHGNRIVFNADTDDMVRGRIYEVNFLSINGIPKIELKKTDDHIPENEFSLTVNLGREYAGKSFWFNGDKWQLAQQHTSINQSPLFDIFDNSGISYSGNNYNTDFAGTKIFGYEVGTGTPDPVLGFPLAYQNTISVGSFKFKNYFNSDTFSLFDNNVVTTKEIALTYLRINNSTSPTFVNVWTEAVFYKIPVLQLYSTIEPTTQIELNAIDNPDTEKFTLYVYVNGTKTRKNVDWYFTVSPKKCFVNFRNTLPSGTNVLFKIFTDALVNSNGQYESPIGLTNNPLNGPIQSVTLTEMSDHLKSMTERMTNFYGSVFGSNNLRDLPDIARYGTRLVANRNPISFSNLFLGIKENNLIDAIQKSADQYNQFKLSLFRKISEIGNIENPVQALDNVMIALNSDKDLNSPWYYSDMLAYGTDKNTRTWIINDVESTVYPIIDDFDPNKLGLRSVLVYLNGEQLLIDKDYRFLSNDSSIEILTTLKVGDELKVEDYFSTEGCYVPSTPTKLGMYPDYQPSIYLDTTYINPVRVIQGHDGSITVAFNDFRDDIILEFEKRVYNNIKSRFRSSLISITSIVPGAFRENRYSIEEVNTILQSDFAKWAGFYSVDFRRNSTFDLDNSYTWNYANGINTDVNVPLTGHWRSAFKYLYDTDRPHTHPWEMLGFSVQPSWWESEYGPAPYTSGNSILWDDLEKGVIRQGARGGISNRYIRPGLSKILPVDNFGNLVSPDTLIANTTPYSIRQDWNFGDQGPSETAWRRSSYWPFAVQRLLALTYTAYYASYFYDPHRINKNIAGQDRYGDNFELLDPRKVPIHGYQGELTSGYSVYISEIGTQRDSLYRSKLKNELTYLDFNLFHKVGGFVDKNKLQIIIDAIEPNSTNPGALLPQENYKLILNVSNPIKSANISGIIVQKSNGKFVINGYNQNNPYFTIFDSKRNSTAPQITVGGISESYVIWTPGSSGGNTGLNDAELATANPAPTGPFYRQGQIVLYGQKYYRATVSHRSGSTFNPGNFQVLKSLPIKGGATVQMANGFYATTTKIPYGAEFDNIQSLYDVIVGYGKWLESEGFIFDEYNADLTELIDWNLSAKEFLFWTTQNWAENNIITLSPFANRVKYTLPNSIVDNVFDNFYEYSILKADGLPIPQKTLNVKRDDGICTVETVGTTEGIYFARINSVQKEHAMVFDNKTIFNDTIYDIETGYRQRRMKLIGFRTGKWNGDYFSPGFVYDRAVVNDWAKYTTYLYGDTVRYNGNYYSAKENVSPSTEFNYNDWVLLKEKPLPDLIPNFEYKISQFEDFYSLDIDNFDSAQQKMAQHLVGYTPRVYLNNIFTNPVSQYKFYQGFIKEKGTKNSINRMAKASIFNLQGETTYTEEWAFRLGNYGSYTSYDELEVKLKEGTFIENPQVINFVDISPVNPVDLIYYSTSTDILIKPDDYSVSLTFPITSSTLFKLPNAGYIHYNDITATAYNENSLLDIANANQIKTNDIIWLGFKSNGDWDVLRYDLQEARITGVYVDSPGISITFVTDLLHGLSIGDIITVTKFNEQVNGVYKVKSIPELNQITVDSTLATIFNDEFSSPGLLHKFKGVRSPSLDQLPSDSEMLKTPIGSKFWVDNQDNDDNLDWRVYEKIENYSKKQIKNAYSNVNQQFGYAINRKENSGVLLVGAPGFNTNIDKGRVFVYIANHSQALLLFSYTLNKGLDQYHTSTEVTEIGSALDYSTGIFPGTNLGIIYAGAPGLGNVRSTGTIIKYALSTGTQLTSVQAGAVKISTADPSSLEEDEEIILLSPQYSNYERFGSALSVNGETNNLCIGAPGTKTTGSGSVYFYQALSPVTRSLTSFTATSGASQIYVNTTASIKVGQNIWIPGIFNDILNGVSVQSIYDDGLSQYITISQSLPGDLSAGTPIKFYNTGSLYSSTAIHTSTNGILVNFVSTITSSTPVTGHQYGYAIDSSSDGKIAVIAAPGGDYVETLINIGTPSVIRAIHTSTFGTGVRFGESIALSRGGEYMFVGAPYIKNDDDSFGKVSIYQRIGNTFTYQTSISNPISGAAMNFGQEITINRSTNTLAISSIGLNTTVPVRFDSENTFFDSSSTFFFDTIENFGTVYVYNKLPESSRFILSAELTPPIEVGLVGTNFGHSIASDDIRIFVGAPSIDSMTTSSFYQFSTINSSKLSLDTYRRKNTVNDIDTVQSIKLINSFNETVVDYLDVIDPIKGKISGLAEQELKYKSAYDPAIYSIGTAGVVVDSDTSWLDEHIGELWWDLSTVKYIWYEQGNLTYRKNNWGSTFPGSTIDVYEWVRSEYLPSDWSSLADTSAGLTEGISGQPKYVDNSSIAVKQIYNNISNSFSNVYYYWVKNKVTVPNSKNRRISAYQVSSIIADPTSYGLKYAALINAASIALANVGPILVDDRIHLNISFDKIKNTVPKHTEWTLLEENSVNSMPPALFEKKLFDSLLGKDSLGNPVPDPTLTDRTRYGIGIRPRQTMFKNRLEALRNLIEFSNEILINHQITGSHRFTNLNSQELPPDEFSNEYDLVVEDNEGLNNIETKNLRQASLSCTILNGKLRTVTVLDSGYGYRKPPTVTLSNGGSGAVIETEIDALGRVISANIVNGGKEYSTLPTLVVRPFSVIVLADNLYNGKWTKFEWNQNNKNWERKQTQKYNTTLYWDYVDWKSTDYNEFVDYTYTVDQVYQLDSLEDLIPGQYVKVKNIGDGRYVVVKKAIEGTQGTFGKGFDLVYSQNGTIQISDGIWNLRNNNLAYDQKNNYDQTLYDQTPDIELSYILNALKEDLFVDELKINWNLFFFKAVKYALTEQKLLDWAFKTSFINVTNYAGILDQRPVYKLQSSENYENYIKEVKPYHSQIRTFTANHQIFEPSNSFITDYDLPAYYNVSSNQFEVIEDGDIQLSELPWKTWNENYTYTVGSIVIGSGGSGYTFPPQVTIETAPGDSGAGATARAYINSGAVSEIEIINPGSNYKIAPRVILTGGGDTNLVPAVVYAQLYNGKVRVNQIGMKFDRISRSSDISERDSEDSFICDGSANEFVLTWYADPDKTKITVTLDDELVLSSNYRLEQYRSLYNGYKKKFTKIVFVNEVPVYGQVLKVQYLKNIDLYNAAERIVEFYTATSGMPGKELSQLMSGIEYPGVKVEALPFDYTTDWDISYSPFGTSSYADEIGYYQKVDVTETAVAGTDTLTISTTTGIALGQLVNVISAVKSQSTTTIFSEQQLDSQFDVRVLGINTATRQVKFNSTLTQSLVTTSSYVYIDDVLTTVTNIASVEFWTYDSNTYILDSDLSGGTWNTSTNSLSGALGINPEEIIIDGDAFITPSTGYAPEELIPGESYDSLAINVYTRYNEGAPTVYNGLVDIFPGVVTSSTLSFTPPHTSSIFVSFDRRNFSYTSKIEDILTSTNNLSYFYLDFAENKIYIPPQTSQGKLGYTIVGIGGGRPNTEAGVIDHGSVIANDGSVEAEVVSISSTLTVKSAYVTVNGVSIPKLTAANTTTLGYMLISSEITPNRAAAHVYNLNSGTSFVQSWFFGTRNKYFNEFREQTFSISASPQTTFVLDFIPGDAEPFAANAIVEINNGTGWRRMQPPFISYYKIDVNQLIYPIDKNIPVPRYGDTYVRVYLNGIRLYSGSNYYFDVNNQTIRLNPTNIKNGDVLAILGYPTGGPPWAEFDINDNILQLRDAVTNCQIRVITFNNHDDMSVQTETFLGNLNRRYKVSREIPNINYVWVTVDGKLLVNKIDYTVLDDGRTVELSGDWYTNSTNFVVITTIASNKLAETVLGYRIFNDIFDRKHYKRLSKKNTTVLTKSLELTDTEIHVADASTLSPPLMSKKIPGVVIIDGERIEYRLLDGNVLKQLRRATLGTSPSTHLPIGTKVLDQGPNQTIPYNEGYLKQVMLTTSSTATYVISGVDVITTATIGGDQVISRGIILSTTSTIHPIDQIEVYYGGRRLRKEGTYYQDTSISFDSPEANIVGFTSTTLLLPSTDVISTAYVVTETNHVWVYTGSIEKDAVNGYVYKGLKYAEPEFSVTVSIDTSTAATYATTATQMAVNLIPLDLSYDLTGNGVVTSADAFRYLRLSLGQYVDNINRNSNYGSLLKQNITLNIADGVKDNIRLEIVKKEFLKADIWNDQLSVSTTKSLMDSTSIPARFLQSKTAELPDDYYFGGRSTLNINSGLALTDEDNKPLEGL